MPDKKSEKVEYYGYQGVNGTEKSNDFEKNDLNSVEPHPGPTIGVRHWQILINFFLVLIAYGFRVSLSVAIVAMTDPNASSNPDIPTYPEWHDKSVALSAFFWGYVIPQIFAGWITSRYGPKWFLVATMAVCSVMSIMLPYMAATFGSKGVMASRAIQGLSQGFFFPSVNNLLGQWAPPQERSRLSTFVFAGGQLGSVIGMLLTGAICASSYGWPLVFYFYGGAGLLWCIVMAIIGSNSPSEHPSITEQEKFYIENSLGHSDEKPRHKTPWKAIFTSVPVWAIIITQCGLNWGYWTLLTEIPTYMSHVMNFNIKSNSILSALPYFVLWVLSFVFSITSDAIVNRNLVSVATSRKIFNTIGLIVPAIALVFLGLTPPNETKKVLTLLVIAVAFCSAMFCGFNLNHMDLSPNHAGTLMGIANGLSNVFGIIAPLTVHLMVTNEQDPEQWKIVFFVAAAIDVVAALFFIVFGKAERQPWDSEALEHEDKDNKAP